MELPMRTLALILIALVVMVILISMASVQGTQSKSLLDSLYEFFRGFSKKSPANFDVKITSPAGGAGGALP